MNNPGALDKHRPHVPVGHQIGVAPPVAQLDVVQTVVLVRWREQRLGEKGKLFGMNGQLAGFRPKQFAGNADEVSEVKPFEKQPFVFREFILAKISLERGRTVGKADERRFAHEVDGLNSAGNPDGNGFLFQHVSRAGAVAGDNIADAVRAGVAGRVGGKTQRGNVGQVLAALSGVFVVFHGVSSTGGWAGLSANHFHPPQDTGQLDAPPVDAGFDRAFRDLELFDDFLVGHFFDVAHDDALPQVG